MHCSAARRSTFSGPQPPHMHGVLHMCQAWEVLPPTRLPPPVTLVKPGSVLASTPSRYNLSSPVESPSNGTMAKHHAGLTQNMPYLPPPWSHCHPALTQAPLDWAHMEARPHTKGAGDVLAAHRCHTTGPQTPAAAALFLDPSHPTCTGCCTCVKPGKCFRPPACHPPSHLSSLGQCLRPRRAATTCQALWRVLQMALWPNTTRG
jgi:hypothetical protein